MDLRFVLKSNINPADIKYNLIIEKWNDKDFIVKVNFSDPYLISQGEERDAAYVSIKNPELFVSKTGLPFNKTQQPIVKLTFPRQLPPGVKAS